MNPQQLEQAIITPTLKAIHLYSDEAKDLILGTCSQETNCGEYIHQINGPALGIYQCEEPTFDDIIKCLPSTNLGMINFACFGYEEIISEFTWLIGNLYFATAICRMHYFRIHEAIPKNTGNRDEYIEALAAYYKEYYNTPLGAATMPDIIANFEKVIKC